MCNYEVITIVLEAVNDHQYRVDRFAIHQRKLIKSERSILIARSETTARMKGHRAEFRLNGRVSCNTSADFGYDTVQSVLLDK